MGTGVKVKFASADRGPCNKHSCTYFSCLTRLVGGEGVTKKTFVSVLSDGTVFLPDRVSPCHLSDFLPALGRRAEDLEI